MRVLIINAILYTNEETIVKKVESVKDCMICDLCRAFVEKGHEVTLIAAEEYKPLKDEDFPFEIVWMKSYFKKIFTANKIPFNVGIAKYLRNHKYDLIISSEVFSLNTLLAARVCPDKLIIWQEMAFHQKMAKQMASKVWHNIVARNLYKGIRIVPRTDNAKEFILKYCDNVSAQVIQHGIDLNKFEVNSRKENAFIISSQLIERKRVDLIIKAFNDFCDNVAKDYKLYIAGDGDKKEELVDMASELKINDKVSFLGKLSHEKLIQYLSNAKAMLVYTSKDNSLISIAESIAVATPIITTGVPDNSKYVNDFGLGIVSDNWDWNDLKTAIDKNETYVNNCISYRGNLDNKHNVDLFIEEMKNLKGAENKKRTQR